MTIGEKIKYYREIAGLNQVELANATGLHPVTIRKYETNKALPHVPQIKKISEVLNVSPNAFWGLEYSNLELNTVGDFMGILYMLLESGELKLTGKRGDDDFLIPQTISFKIENQAILEELIKWEKMNEMYSRVAEGKENTSEDVFNALIERMDELKAGAKLETQRSSILLDANKTP